MNVTLTEIGSIKPYEKNARTHSKKQISQIAKSIEAFGWGQPIAVDRNNVIIAGHGRWEAAKALGLPQVPVLTLDLPPEKVKAYRLADNRLYEDATWDMDLVLPELKSLDAELFDLTGFDRDLIAEPATEDDVPPLPVEAVAKRGDLYALGEHRVMCGDATDSDDVLRLTNGETGFFCLTDPPYGLGDTESKKNKYATYDDTKENLEKLINGFFLLANSVSKRIVLTPGNRNQLLYAPPTWTMAWFTAAGTGMGPWGFICWQPILCYGKDPKLAARKGSHPDAIVHTEASEKLGHPCSKPVKFWSWLMERAGNPDETVYDPFGGSGTGLIAAEQLGRKCYTMEIDPRYVDVIIARWEKLTGKKAEKLPEKSV